MTVIEPVHRELGATFVTVDGRRVPAQYGRPERAHLATRNAVGLLEPPYAVLELDRDERATLVPLLTADLPATDGRAAFGRLVDDAVRGEATVLVAEDRLLCLVAGGHEWLTDRVDARDRTDEFGVFGVHGPQATEKVAGVLHGAGAPDDRLAFTRGRMNEAGVTVLRTDDPAGEEGYEVLCAASAARDVHDTLLVRGPNAAPVGYRTWETLTLEAGTPLPADLDGRPAAVLAGATDTDRLVGLAPETVPAAGAPVRDDGRRVGRVSRAAHAPSLDRPLALAWLAPTAARGDSLAVETGDGPVAATVRPLPFVAGSARSGRVLPTG